MEPTLPPVRDGYDVTIKILTIIKLLIQVALWGLALGFTVWMLTHNPLPGIMASMQEQLMKSFTIPAP